MSSTNISINNNSSTVTSNIQNLIAHYAIKHKMAYPKLPFQLCINAQEVKSAIHNAINNGEVELSIDSNGYVQYRYTDGRLGHDKDFTWYLTPIKVSKNGIQYDGDGERIDNILIFDYIIPNRLGVSNEVLDCIRKLNSTPHKLWKGVLKYDRKPKETINDPKGLDIFNQESKWARIVVGDNDDTFYLPHQLDKRGRVYPLSYPITYQGDEWIKASNMLDLPEITLTQNGWKALKHDVANHYGLDKESYDVKEKFADNLVNADRNKADKPILFDRAVEFYNKALSTGKTDFSVCIDATASGLQILSILANCAETAQYTNLTDPSRCYDIYAKAAEKVIEHCGFDKNNKALLKEIRKVVKKPVMTGTYNSEAQSRIAADTLNSIGWKITKDEMLSICESSKAVGNIKAHMKECFRRYGQLSDIKDKTIIRYMMPDGFICELPIISKSRQYFKDDVLGFGCMVKFDIRQYNFLDGWRSFLPNMIHSIDAYICREMIRRTHYYNKNSKTFKSFDIATIHDCFIVHPNYVNIVRRNYLTILKELQEMDIMNYIMNQIHPSFVYDNGYKNGVKNFDIAIDENSYALC